MQNKNALIAIAIVSSNADNPYAVFDEYIKYCMAASQNENMSLSEIRNAAGEEFGLYIPYNVMMRCLSQIEKTGLLVKEGHQFRRTGSYDPEEFDRKRTEYRAIEDALIQPFMEYAKQYGRDWTYEHAKKCLVS